MLVVSPYSRRAVSHVHTSMLSILKTMEHILGLPPLNQYDAAATDLSDRFTDIPDVSPYVALPSDTEILIPPKRAIRFTACVTGNRFRPPSRSMTRRGFAER